MSKKTPGFQKGNKIGNRFKKGEVANPEGARIHKKNIHKRKITDWLEKIGDELCIEKVEVDGKEEIITRTNFERLMRAVYDFALTGESWAVNFIAERTEGKILQPLGLEPIDEGEIGKLHNDQKLEILIELIKNASSITDGAPENTSS